MQRICVYCGASSGTNPEYSKAAANLGRAIAEAGLGLVYGGGRVGLMGIMAEAALEMGGEVIGVIPKRLCDLELDHRQLSERHLVDTMHERKALMEDLADSFIALPGGVGTLDEFFEIWTWAQLGFHTKPFGLINVAGYYDPLLEFLRNHAVGHGFIEKKSFDVIMVETEPRLMIKRFKNYIAPDIQRRLSPQ